MSLPGWAGIHNRRRRWIQASFLAVFVLVPLLDLFRFDFPAGRLHAFGKELWLDEWALVWLALMFGMWIIGAVSLVLGRVYCGYACPQMVFNELAGDVDVLARKLVRGVTGLRRPAAIRAASWTILAVGSLAVSILFMGYFAPLREVLARLARFDLGPWVGLVTVGTALLVFLDFALVRERFCRSVCPYGILQAVLEDGKSLHVALDTATGPCIECNACAKVCPMEIDIRKDPFQIECTRCGACIDACAKVLAPKKRPSILAFRFGTAAGAWDLKRILVAVATAGFGVAFVVVLALREDVTLHLAPLYGQGEGSAVAESRFSLKATNRSPATITLRVAAEGLAEGTRIEGLDDPDLPAGGEKRFTLVVRPGGEPKVGTPVPFVLRVDAAKTTKRFPAVWYVPSRRSS